MTTVAISFTIIGYLVLAGLLVYLSILLSNYVDMLDKVTKLSGALLGGILLAAVTSLPELFTTLTAVIGVGETKYVIGNIMGSNVFDIVMLSLCFLVFFKNAIKGKISKTTAYQLIILIVMIAIATFAIFMPQSIRPYFYLGKNGWFNWLVLLILGLYILSLFIVDKEDEKDEDDAKEVKYSKKGIIVRFIICSIVLIGCSIGVTYCSDLIVDYFKIDPTSGGAVLLGVMTSLPEIISTFNLFYKKNVAAGSGNMIGSGTFNMMIFVVAELFSWNNSVFDSGVEAGNTNKLIILGSISIVTCLGALLFKLLYSRYDKKGSESSSGLDATSGSEVTSDVGTSVPTSKLKDSKSIRLLSSVFVITFAVISVVGYILYFAIPDSYFQFQSATNEVVTTSLVTTSNVITSNIPSFNLNLLSNLIRI